MVAKAAVKTAGWVAFNWVCEVFGLMADCQDRRMTMLLFASRAAWVAVGAANRKANYIVVN